MDFIAAKVLFKGKKDNFKWLHQRKLNIYTYFFYKQLGSGNSHAYIFKVFAAQSCIMVA